VLSGGRYDGLVEECGGSPTPGVGFGSGVERVLLAMEAEQSQPVAPEPITAFVITLGDAARKAGLKLLADLRAVGLAADTDYAGRSMKAQMKEANRCGARYAVIIGEDEVAHNAATVKDLATSEQASVRMESLVGSLVE